MTAERQIAREKGGDIRESFQGGIARSRPDVKKRDGFKYPAVVSAEALSVDILASFGIRPCASIGICCPCVIVWIPRPRNSA